MSVGYPAGTTGDVNPNQRGVIRRRDTVAFMNIRIAVLAPIAMVLSACGGTTSTTPTTSSTLSQQEIEAAVIKTCQGSVKKQLKDPDSAKFSDWKAWIVTHHDKPPRVSNYHPENGDTLYSAGGNVNAKNSFGGYVGYQMYGCDASVTKSDDVNALAYSLNDILNPTTEDSPEATP
jgi:hypothetical protein